MILPLAALQVPFAVLLTRNFINGLPDELFEAARVDGASSLRGFRLPRHSADPTDRGRGLHLHADRRLERLPDAAGLPAVAPTMQTITLVPQFFVGEFSNDQTKILASAVITAIPEIVAYLCLQGLFERGLSAGAIK